MCFERNGSCNKWLGFQAGRIDVYNGRTSSELTINKLTFTITALKFKCLIFLFSHFCHRQLFTITQRDESAYRKLLLIQSSKNFWALVDSSLVLKYLFSNAYIEFLCENVYIYTFI